MRCRRQRRKRYGTSNWRDPLRKRISIGERPAVVDCRAWLGDGELDMMIGTGHHQTLVSLMERKSWLSLFAKVEWYTADLSRLAVIRLLKSLGRPLYAPATDKDKVLVHHEAIAQASLSGSSVRIPTLRESAG